MVPLAGLGSFSVLAFDVVLFVGTLGGLTLSIGKVESMTGGIISIGMEP